MDDKNFILNLTHDLKIPMNSIIGYTDLALSIEKNDKVKEYLNKISIASDHMMSLVNNILYLSKIGNKKLYLNNEYCSLKQNIREVNDLLEKQLVEKNISLRITDNLIINDIINVDKLKLKQVLINLISNAIKYSYKNSIINLLIKEKIIDNRNSDFIFLIKDNGIGMSEKFIEKAFDIYSRSDEVIAIEGNGLGLSISKEIINEMGGIIKINSEINKGTELYFNIKVEVKKEDIKKKILIVEDDELNRDLIKEFLCCNNYYCEEATNGKEAYEMIINNKKDYYGLIIMDTNMPIIDGIECTKLIRNFNDERSEIPIILMSGSELNDKFNENVINDFINKPISYKDFLMLIKKYI